jgi:hypothetical protein|tara:strand:- start:3330 stop:4145 length:816 start_codon:yes stop_codon:yes gene_type:complete
MMTNDISVNKMTDSEVMSAIGQTLETNRPILSRLTINRDAEDDDGNRLPSGHYSVYHPELETNVYGENVDFRPFYTSYQYMAYNPSERKYSSRSVIFRNWKENIIDSQGTERCGKLTEAQKVNLNDADKELQKNIKCYKMTYGTVSFKGKTATGEDVDIKDFPVLWRNTGSNYNIVNEAFTGLTNLGKPMFKYTLTLGTEKRKAGSNRFSVSTYTINKDKELPFTESDEKILQNFLNIIGTENQYVKKQYDSNTAQAVSDGDAAKIIEQLA